uniref:Uncharacterized protein n=1 Tax=Candidatus Kentrum sp. LFY TaxID=2126342 RepID=A0A450VBN0_9GAMM|nr:MAG: hypothetical protein BECKLFY1418B_GA0070995_12991 [Candidatus Kentron sp. LFY]
MHLVSLPDSEIRCVSIRRRSTFYPCRDKPEHLKLHALFYALPRTHFEKRPFYKNGVGNLPTKVGDGRFSQRPNLIFTLL